MAEITLGLKPEAIEVLKVNIGDESYSLPLAGSLSINKARKMADDDSTFEFFCEHIPREVLEDLSIDDIKALTAAWIDASQESSGIELGEL